MAAVRIAAAQSEKRSATISRASSSKPSGKVINGVELTELQLQEFREACVPRSALYPHNGASPAVCVRACSCAADWPPAHGLLPAGRGAAAAV